mmetsp:Transcript_80076/g.144554  ORF Transcript_80076/g.144554 Transcript_80076/m.144554 type:complete len:208 (+) Transcript_80076:1254-1877(+)
MSQRLDAEAAQQVSKLTGLHESRTIRVALRKGYGICLMLLPLVLPHEAKVLLSFQGGKLRDGTEDLVNPLWSWRHKARQRQSSRQVISMHLLVLLQLLEDIQPNFLVVLSRRCPAICRGVDILSAFAPEVLMRRAARDVLFPFQRPARTSSGAEAVSFRGAPLGRSHLWHFKVHRLADRPSNRRSPVSFRRQIGRILSHEALRATAC